MSLHEWALSDRPGFMPISSVRNALAGFAQAWTTPGRTWVASVDEHGAYFFVRARLRRRLRALNIYLPARISVPEHNFGVCDPVQTETREEHRMRSEYLRQVAEFLHLSRQRGAYQRLVVAAPRTTLEPLKIALSPTVKNAVVLELDTRLDAFDPNLIHRQWVEIMRA